MFDELYNKTKKQLVSGKEKPQSKDGIVLPVATPQGNQTSVAQAMLSSEEQKLLLQKRKHIPGWVLFLKYFSIALTIIGIVGVVWISVDLDKNNKYLAIFNATENTGSRYERLKKMQKKMEQESLEYASKISRLEQQLQSKNYSINTDTVQKLKAQQITWFDLFDEEGNIATYGILHGPERAAEYFNSKSFENPILSNTGNDISVDAVSANRNDISFGVHGAHLFGKTFFLNTEFVALMNSFPIYKGESLNSFSKKLDNNGNQSMDFSLKLSLQTPDEIDPADSVFVKYEKWLQNITTKKQ